MWTTLPFYSAPGVGTSACNLYRGMVGAHVEALRHTLRPCWGQPIGIDGQFGPATQSAVRNVQRALGLIADGNYGPNTRQGIQNRGKWRAVSGGLASQWPVCAAVIYLP
jgi:peptidoglycan hydrolase-like protein with peptidoglycan-binding domain